MNSVISNIMKMFKRRNSEFLAYHGFKEVQWSEVNYNSVADKYLSNPIINKCVNLISTNLAAIPIELRKGGKKIAKHDVLNVIAKPNSQQDMTEFFEEITSLLLLAGEVFIEKIQDEEGVPIELNILRPDKVDVILNNKMQPKQYEYFNGESKRIIQVNQLTGESAICHIKMFNPIGQRGVSKMQAIMPLVDLYNYAMRHNCMMLQNSGRPSGALVVDSDEVNLTDEQKGKLRDDISRMYQGADNAGKIMLLEGPFKWVEMAMSSKDFDYMGAINMSCSLISVVLGVPSALLGGALQNHPTYSNYKEAKIGLIENTIVPMMKKILGALSMLLLQNEPDMYLSYDHDYVREINEKN